MGPENATYRIQGRTFGRNELLSFSRKCAGDQGRALWEREVYGFIAWFLDPASGSIQQQTSGTTGQAREMLIPRESMVASALRTLEFFGLREGDTALLCLPVEYIAGKMMVARALVGGLDLYLAKPSSRPFESAPAPASGKVFKPSPDLTSSTVSKPSPDPAFKTFSQPVPEKVRFASMVPLQFQTSLEAGDDLSRIGILLLGGAESSPELRQKMQGTSMPDLYESFGMTETCSHFALRRLNGSEASESFRALEGVRLSTDSRDCLVVDVEGVTPAPIVTNDMVELKSDGISFRWLGRIDNVINTGGIKVNPETLEEEIAGILGTSCLVLSRPDVRLGEKLVLLAESNQQELPGDWHDLLSALLDPHLRPREIYLVPQLPRNASYKPDRHEAQRIIDQRSEDLP